MNFEEKCNLLMQAKINGCKMKDMSAHMDCSVSWVSQMFANKVDWSNDSMDKLVQFINNYQSNK